MYMYIYKMYLEMKNKTDENKYISEMQKKILIVVWKRRIIVTIKHVYSNDMNINLKIKNQ